MMSFKAEAYASNLSPGRAEGLSSNILEYMSPPCLADLAWSNQALARDLWTILVPGGSALLVSKPSR